VHRAANQGGCEAESRRSTDVLHYTAFLGAQVVAHLRWAAAGLRNRSRDRCLRWDAGVKRQRCTEEPRLAHPGVRPTPPCVLISKPALCSTRPVSSAALRTPDRRPARPLAAARPFVRRVKNGFHIWRTSYGWLQPGGTAG
jgi:hypothetical protein